DEVVRHMVRHATRITLAPVLSEVTTCSHSVAVLVVITLFVANHRIAGSRSGGRRVGSGRHRIGSGRRRLAPGDLPGLAAAAGKKRQQGDGRRHGQHRGSHLNIPPESEWISTIGRRYLVNVTDG